MLSLRPLGEGDDRAVFGLFEATMLLGKPLPFALTRGRAYAELSLGWYLSNGRGDAAVVVDELDRIVGYALLCVDPDGYDRWARAATARFIGRNLGWLASGRLRGDSLRFYRARALDLVTLWRGHRDAPIGVHAHLNLERGARNATGAVLLRDHLDRRAGRVGATEWFGEMNARRGERAKALERLGLEVVTRRPNRTFSQFVGTPVERLTLRRRLDSALPPPTVPRRSGIGATFISGSSGRS